MYMRRAKSVCNEFVVVVSLSGGVTGSRTAGTARTRLPVLPPSPAARISSAATTATACTSASSATATRTAGLERTRRTAPGSRRRRRRSADWTSFPVGTGITASKERFVFNKCSDRTNRPTDGHAG